MSLAPLPDGWTGWVGDPKLASVMRGKWRPFCRGRAIRSSVIWFPRTGKPPREGERFGIFSPALQLPGLTNSGWFITNVFVRRPTHYHPAPSRACGVLPDDVVDAIYAKLSRHYWSDDDDTN
jgi:hypothetical protein